MIKLFDDINKYVVKFDDDEIDDDVDVKFINYLIINDIDYDIDPDDENIIIVYR